MRAWEEGNLNRLLSRLREHEPQASEPDRRGFEWWFLDGLAREEIRDGR